MKEKEYLVSCNEDQDEWYIVRRWTTNGTMRRKVLSPRYFTSEDATEVMVAMFEAAR